MNRKDLPKFLVTGLVGAALAFPAGLLVASLGGGSPSAAPDRPREAAPVRDVYSPALRNDPWFLDRQREGVESLEAHCRRSGDLCAEAREARRWLDEHGG